MIKKFYSNSSSKEKFFDKDKKDENINEIHILKQLVCIWNEFITLAQHNPQHCSEICDFENGIHKCQYVIMARLARKDHPDIFPIDNNRKD